MNASDIGRIPKGFVAPIHPTGKTISVIVDLKGQPKYQLNIGGVGEDGGDSQTGRNAFLLHRHVKLIMRLLRGDNWDGPVRPATYTQLMGGSWGKQNALNVRKYISEMRQIFCERIELDAENNPVSKATYERLIDIVVENQYHPHDKDDWAFRQNEQNVKERSIKQVIFSPSFYMACAHPEGFWPINYDEVAKCDSDLEQVLYMYLPGKIFRGAHEKDPLKLDLVDLMVGLLGYSPNTPIRELARLLSRDRVGIGSVLQRLSGRPTFDSLLHVRLEPQSRGPGYNLCAWLVDPVSAEIPKEYGEMEKAWMLAGFDIREFVPAMNMAWRTVEDHEIDILRELGYNPVSNLRFLEKVRSFLGYVRFNEAIHAAKGLVASGRVTSPGEAVGGCLMEAYRTMLMQRAKARMASQKAK